MPSADLSCRCGEVAGVCEIPSPSAVNHLICYCRDCRGYAEHLGAADVLDAQGGTELFQISPARVSLTRGTDRIACLRMSAKGPLRFHTTCCNVPVANTLADWRMPFAGLSAALLDGDRAAVEALLGPVRMRIMARDALAPPVEAEHVHDGFPPSSLLWVMTRMIGWRLRGDHARSPFFDAATGQPIAAPRRVDETG